MVHKHLANGSNKVHVYCRKYIGEGLYYQKMVSPNEVIEGDQFKPHEKSEILMKVVKVISKSDSHARGFTEEERVNALCEVELFDETYKKEDNNYKPIYSI